MKTTADIFSTERALVGMVHLHALPGTPKHRYSIKRIMQMAVEEARLLVDEGFDSILLENMHDVPYLRRDVGPEIVSAMTSVCGAVRAAVDVPLGVQILAGANHASLAVAHVIGAQFIRAEGFVFASVADEGLIGDADAGPLLRYRRAIGAENVSILADIRKKHSAHAITSDVDVCEYAKAAEFFGADGVIITGLSTGQAIRIDDLGTARVATKLPLVVGSGVTPQCVEHLFAYADALIVGSWYKHDGVWSQPPDPARVRQLVAAVHAAR